MGKSYEGLKVDAPHKSGYLYITGTYTNDMQDCIQCTDREKNHIGIYLYKNMYPIIVTTVPWDLDQLRRNTI